MTQKSRKRVSDRRTGLTVIVLLAVVVLSALSGSS